jgi:CBS domain-containing protein
MNPCAKATHMNRDVTVREVVNRGFVGVSEADDLVETVRLLVEEEAATAVVLRGSEPVGLVTDRDVLALLAADGSVHEATVEAAMQPSVPTVGSDTTIGEAADRLAAESSGRLVVVDGGEILGVLTGRDLLATRPAPTNGPEAAAPAMDADTAGAVEDQQPAASTFEDQGICESCGTLNSDLVAFNGQLLCDDCRDR